VCDQQSSTAEAAGARLLLFVVSRQPPAPVVCINPRIPITIK
jgi:hypothetical protein